MITLLDKQGREIQEQDTIIERIQEFYSELFDSDQAVTIQTDPKEVPPIMAWEVEAAVRKMKNGKEPGKDQVNIETLKAGDETIAKQLAKLYRQITYMPYTNLKRSAVNTTYHCVLLSWITRRHSIQYKPKQY